jgi:hypothetical protein
VAVDFFLVPTLTFRLLFVFVGLRHDRRELIHVNVTDHPTAGWAARQLIEAFPEGTATKYLLRDRDAIYGEVFTRCVSNMEIRHVITAPRAPWQNPFVERVIGSIRRGRPDTLSTPDHEFVPGFLGSLVVQALSWIWWVGTRRDVDRGRATRWP